ncbi:MULTISPECIES: EAL domain-containing protein [Bacillus]|uniref:EAL domain-containing protein n=1 Tax=Bacillus TaxID=1386 RepID=UPI0012FEA077|nr:MULTISPECIES: EAL domain-containing protein [Bacillus]
MERNLKKWVKKNSFEHVYQPIWNMDKWQIIGYESFIRFDNYEVGSIERVFSEARKQDLLFDLDTISILGAINNFPTHLLNNTFLFVNIYPSTILHPFFETFLKKLVRSKQVIQGKVIFEINETMEEASVWSSMGFKNKLSIFKKYNVFFALDDVGKGVATIEKIKEFQPDYVKLYREIANDLSVSIEKQKFVSTLEEYCKKQKIGFVMEGLEKETDLAFAKLLKISLGQGFLIGKPQILSEETIILNDRALV